MCSRVKGNLHPAIHIVNAVARFHVVRVNVCEPAYATTGRILEVFAMLIQENEVVLRSISWLGLLPPHRGSLATHVFVLCVSHSVWTVWLHTRRSNIRPAILSMKVRLCLRAKCRRCADLIKIHLFTITVFNEPVQVILHKRPRIIRWKEDCEKTERLHLSGSLAD